MPQNGPDQERAITSLFDKSSTGRGPCIFFVKLCREWRLNFIHSGDFELPIMAEPAYPVRRSVL